MEDNRDTAPYELNQYGSWYLLAGIECYLEAAMDHCQFVTLMAELDRLEGGEKQHGGFYEYEYAQERFAELRARIPECIDACDAVEEEEYDRQWRAEEAMARRSKFYVVPNNGG